MTEKGNTPSALSMQISVQVTTATFATKPDLISLLWTTLCLDKAVYFQTWLATSPVLRGTVPHRGPGTPSGPQVSLPQDCIQDRDSEGHLGTATSQRHPDTNRSVANKEHKKAAVTMRKWTNDFPWDCMGTPWWFLQSLSRAPPCPTWPRPASHIWHLCSRSFSLPFSHRGEPKTLTCACSVPHSQQVPVSHPRPLPTTSSSLFS